MERKKQGSAAAIPARAAAVLFVALLALLAIPGCTNNSKYTPCCERMHIVDNETPWNILGSPKCYVQDSTFGRLFYGDCPGTTKEDVGNGTAICQIDANFCQNFNSDKVKCSMAPGCFWSSTACVVGSAKPCSDLTSQGESVCKQYGCIWDPALSSCGGGSANPPMPVCVDDVPKQCINNRCTAMMCGYRGLKPSPPPSSQDWTGCENLTQTECTPDPTKTGKCAWDTDSKSCRATNVIAEKEVKAGSINLYQASCSLKTMNTKLYNSVKNSKGSLWVNAFRFGVGSSFSDFEQSRYFFPASDRFCSGTVPIAGQKDRFVNYLNAKDTWCAETSSYYECTENGMLFAKNSDPTRGGPDYFCSLYCGDVNNCVEKSGTAYACLESGFAYPAKEDCKKDCNIIENPKLCTDSSGTYPFLESDTRYKTKYISDYYIKSEPEKLYSDSSCPRPPFSYSSTMRLFGVDQNGLDACMDNTPWGDWNYWKGSVSKQSAVELDYDYYKNALENAYTPPGQRRDAIQDYECASDGDCVSGYCSYDTHIRGLCKNTETGASEPPKLDCGCYKYGEKLGGALNCEDAMKTGATTEEKIYKSTIRASVDVAGWSTSIPPSVSPWWQEEDNIRWKVNEVMSAYNFFEKQDNVGGNDAPVYRFYIDAGLAGGAGAIPQPEGGPRNKFFQYCGIKTSDNPDMYDCNNQIALPAVPVQPIIQESLDKCHRDIKNTSDWTRTTDGTDMIRAQKMCLYLFKKATPHGGCCGWNSEETSYSYVTGITPLVNGGCPDLTTWYYKQKQGDGSTWTVPRQFGTYNNNDDDYFITIHQEPDGTWTNGGEVHWFWVYELNMQTAANDGKIGKCAIQNSFAPYFDVTNLGWCEGCTYSTMAVQNVTWPAEADNGLACYEYRADFNYSVESGPAGAGTGSYAIRDVAEPTGQVDASSDAVRKSRMVDGKAGNPVIGNIRVKDRDSPFVCEAGWGGAGSYDGWAKPADPSQPYLADKMSVYLKSNIMPILDVQSAATSVSGGANIYRPLEICQEYNGDGAAVYAVADAGERKDPSRPDTEPLLANIPSDTRVGEANLGSTTSFGSAYPDLNNYLGGTLDENGVATLDGKGAAIVRAMLLKKYCNNPPMAAIAINGYDTFAKTSDLSTGGYVDRLIGSKSNQGQLHQFFYKKTPTNLLQYESAVAKGTPDKYPNNIDMLLQEWHPTCDYPSGGSLQDRIKAEFSGRVNFSRGLLANFSKPSIIWRFHFPDGSPCYDNSVDPNTGKPKGYQTFLDYVFSHKGELVDGGIMGIIYDAWMTDTGKAYAPSGLPIAAQEWDLTSVAAEGRLDDPGAGKTSTPFCALQESSRNVLGITTQTYGQKVYATNFSIGETCECEKCTDASYALGLCDREIRYLPRPAADETPQLFCAGNGNAQCQLPPGVNYWEYFCPPTCSNFNSCTPCSDTTAYNTAQAVCRVESSNGDVTRVARYYNAVAGDLTNPGLGERDWDIIAALPNQDKCCIEKKEDETTLRYTFLQRKSAKQRSEFLQFPTRGELDLDCGRTPDTSVLKYCNVEIPLDEKDIYCRKVG